MYVFPPFSILQQVLQKIELDQAEVVLIAPLFANQCWFPKLLKLVAGQCYVIPKRKDRSIMPTDIARRHPLIKMRLGCFRLPGNSSRTKTYQQKLSTPLLCPGENQQEFSIGHISGNGCYFVNESKLIHLRHL
jgi:hypothetical protein